MEMRIEKQGERRAEGKREIGAIGAEARSHRLWQQQLLLRHFGEDRAVTTELRGITIAAAITVMTISRSLTTAIRAGALSPLL